jgi:hypothetical protein
MNTKSGFALSIRSSPYLFGHITRIAVRRTSIDESFLCPVGEVFGIDLVLEMVLSDSLPRAQACLRCSPSTRSLPAPQL